MAPILPIEDEPWAENVTAKEIAASHAPNLTTLANWTAPAMTGYVQAGVAEELSLDKRADQTAPGSTKRNPLAMPGAKPSEVFCVWAVFVALLGMLVALTVADFVIKCRSGKAPKMLYKARDWCQSWSGKGSQHGAGGGRSEAAGDEGERADSGGVNDPEKGKGTGRSSSSEDGKNNGGSSNNNSSGSSSGGNNNSNNDKAGGGDPQRSNQKASGNDVGSLSESDNVTIGNIIRHFNPSPQNEAGSSGNSGRDNSKDTDVSYGHDGGSDMDMDHGNDQGVGNGEGSPSSALPIPSTGPTERNNVYASTAMSGATVPAFLPAPAILTTPAPVAYATTFAAAPAAAAYTAALGASVQTATAPMEPAAAPGLAAAPVIVPSPIPNATDVSHSAATAAAAAAAASAATAVTATSSAPPMLPPMLPPMAIKERPSSLIPRPKDSPLQGKNSWGSLFEPMSGRNGPRGGASGSSKTIQPRDKSRSLTAGQTYAGPASGTTGHDTTAKPSSSSLEQVVDQAL